MHYLILHPLVLPPKTITPRPAPASQPCHSYLNLYPHISLFYTGLLRSRFASLHASLTLRTHTLFLSEILRFRSSLANPFKQHHPRKSLSHPKQTYLTTPSPLQSHPSLFTSPHAGLLFLHLTPSLLRSLTPTASASFNIINHTYINTTSPPHHPHTHHY